MRILGLDYGSRTVGVAVSDPLGITAQPVEIIRRKEENKLRRTLARIEELKEEYQAEMLVFPGGGTGVENLWNDDRVSALIQEAARRDIWLAALCAGPILLGRWGLLDGHKAVSYPTRQDQLGRAQVLPEARAVLDGKFVTGHACGSSFDFGLKLVEALRGPQAAQAVNEHIFYRR